MGEHGAPQSFLDRWRDTEPVRLWLYGVTVPALAAAVVYGWLTTEQMGAWLAVAAAALLGVGAMERARRIVWAPATVNRELQLADRRAYAEGHDDGARSIGSGVPMTVAMRQVGRCRNVEGGRRCVMPAHPEAVVHQYD